MKKLLIALVAITGFCFSVNVQNIIIQQDNKKTERTTKTEVDNINGIPFTADIGGVETNVTTFARSHTKMNGSSYEFSLTIKNYNKFSVIVLYKIVDEEEKEYSGSIVVLAEEEKSKAITNVNTCFYCQPEKSFSIKTITRKL